MDYSPRSSGLHWSDFDDIWLQRPWDELHLGEYRSQIKRLLDSGAIWLSGLDLETVWLANSFRSHPNLLVPSSVALERTAKPAILVAQALRLRMPNSTAMSISDWEIHSFARRHAWRIWVKGPFYEARRVRNWRALAYAREELSATWGEADDLMLQEHVAGHEESIAFSAYRGRVVAWVAMTKRDVTPEGKTWAARVSDVPREIGERVAELVADLQWTGGAEIELVRDAEGQLALIEWNPRFPAWVHGATLAGDNLPGALIEAATGVPMAEATGQNNEFVRVVVEIPARMGYPLLPAAGAFAESMTSSKHPSGMPVLAKRLRRPPRRSTGSGGTALPFELSADLAEIDVESLATPCAALLARTAEAAFSRARELVSAASSGRLDARVAYSIKTNPDDRLMQLALRKGFLAEAISHLEASKAIMVGFRPQDVVLNGPAKRWPDGAIRFSAGAVFADSVDELELLAREAYGPIVGVRLRPPGLGSRFGVDIADHQVFGRVAELARQLPPEVKFGAHFHIASSLVGTHQWWRALEGVLRWSVALEVASNRPIVCFDIGGGWFPDDFVEQLGPRLPSVAAAISDQLKDVGLLIVELGKAIAQPAMAVLTRVLEVRQSGQAIDEVIVDASVAELPEATAYPHRVLGFDPRASAWQSIGPGRGRVLGRLCMEDDVLVTGLALPGHLRPGDILAIRDAGAYDRSMSYAFARG